MSVGQSGASPLPRAPRQTKAKRHHYIPEMTQRRFAGPDLRLWSFDKRYPERGVKRKPIALLFREWHLYTVRRADGTRDTSTETRLSAIESRAELVIARVVADARAGRPTAFSLTDHLALVDLFVAQYRRAPDSLRGPIAARMAQDLATTGAARWEALYGPMSDEERRLLTDPEFLLQGRRETIASDAASPLGTATEAMQRRGFSIARIGVPNRSFMLGSNPVVRFRAKGSGRQDLDEPATELWMPVAHDIALVSCGAAGASRFVELRHDRLIRQINSAVVDGSTVFASATRELVEAWARRIPRGMRLHGEWDPPP